MGDYIERDKAIKIVESHYRVDNDLLEVIAYQISNLPSADVQPVVRCRECIWLIRGDDRLFEDCVCDNAESPVFATDEDFGCIYAERKGADNDSERM